MSLSRVGIRSSVEKPAPEVVAVVVPLPLVVDMQPPAVPLLAAAVVAAVVQAEEPPFVVVVDRAFAPVVVPNIQAGQVQAVVEAVCIAVGDIPLPQAQAEELAAEAVHIASVRAQEQAVQSELAAHGKELGRVGWLVFELQEPALGLALLLFLRRHRRSHHHLHPL